MSKNVPYLNVCKSENLVSYSGCSSKVVRLLLLNLSPPKKHSHFTLWTKNSPTENFPFKGLCSQEAKTFMTPSLLSMCLPAYPYTCLSFLAGLVILPCICLTLCSGLILVFLLHVFVCPVPVCAFDTTWQSELDV